MLAAVEKDNTQDTNGKQYNFCTVLGAIGLVPGRTRKDRVAANAQIRRLAL